MYPPHHLGGYEVVWQGAMRHLRAAGHEVRLLVSDHRQPAVAEPDEPNVHRTLRWYWSWERYEFDRLGPLARLRRERRNAAELRRHLTEQRPDVVTFWPMGAMSLSLIAQVAATGIPTVLVVHDDWLVYGPRADGWTRLWTGPRRGRLAPLAERLTGIPTRFDPGVATAIWFNSRFMLERARGRGLNVPRSEVLTPGIDRIFLDRGPVKDWKGRLLCVGRLDRQKGIDTAIDALRLLPPQTTLTVAGTGDREYSQELQRQVSALGLDSRVHWMGPVAREALPALYRQADAVVFPVRWDEPWGLVPLEAMGVGTPVVATARGGSTEFLEDDNNALVFDADDAPMLAACVDRLRLKSQLRERLRAHGFETAARHTSSLFESRFAEMLERVADPAQEPR